jgi:D-3-phosphoglycerate dehydrogenase / 2-oxoglutarate reductase
MAKVLISDNLSPRAAEIFSAHNVEADVRTGMSPAELIACIDAYDGLAVRSATKVTPDVLAAAARLKVIGRAGIGVDNIDIGAASARGIVVMNTPFGNSITTAEHAIALMFALARQITAADRSTQAGKWEKSRFMGVEVTGKTLGIIGCGNIGSIVADRALGLKMRVVAYDPYLSPERAADLGVEKVELDDLLRRADFITLHTPLTEATRHILDEAAFARMKDGVYVINCARGDLIAEDALKAAVEARKVAGVALDVFPREPPVGYSLLGMEQLVATPHLGAATLEAQEKVALQVAEQMADFLTTGAVVNAINMPSVSAEEAPRLRPYMRLAEQIGSLAGQVTESGIKTVEISYEGHAAELNSRPLTACALKGLLSPMLESVNMVNAPIMARERGLDVREVKREQSEEYQSLIRLSVTTERRTRTVAGTLFGDKLRIVNVNGIPLEAELGSCMLYTVNADKPGFIGRLGSALGEAGVNVSTFHLGRSEPGGTAIALIGIDGEPDEAFLKTVCAFPDVVQAKVLRF